MLLDLGMRVHLFPDLPGFFGEKFVLIFKYLNMFKYFYTNYLFLKPLFQNRRFVGFGRLVDLDGDVKR